MNIFDKRPLASILCIYLVGFVAFSEGEVWLRICTLAIIPLLLILSCIKINLSKLFIGMAAALAISAILSYVYFDVFFYVDNKFVGDTEIIGSVCEVEADKNSGQLIIETETIADESFPTYKIVVYYEQDNADSIKVGDVIKFRGKISGFDQNTENHLRRIYTAKGVSGKCLPSDAIEVISHGEAPLEYRVAQFRERLTRRAMMLSDNSSGKLISALILGEKDALDGKLQLDFTRIGVTHMLALSGMNTAILAFGITKLLAFFGIGKRTAGYFNIIFTLMYLFLTGFPLSVVRAGIMLIIATALFLTIGSRDSITSLAIAVFLICLFEPTAIFDISLWLSAFATLGIIALSEYESAKTNRRIRQDSDNRPLCLRIIFGILNWIKLSLLASIFAIACTALISLLTFKDTSVLSALATMILTPLVTLFMYIGALTLIIGDIIPIGAILSPITEAITGVASWLSSFDGIYISSSYTVAIILCIITTVALLIFLLFPLRNSMRKISLVVIAVLLSSMYLSLYIGESSAKDENDIFYVNDEKSSTFVLKCEQETALLCSTSYNDFSIKYVSAAMEQTNLSELDYYMVTHYGYGLIGHFKMLASDFMIRSFVLPRPRNDDEEGILNKIKKIADEYDISIKFFESKTPFKIGSFGITLNHSTPYGQDTIRSAFTIDDGDTIYTYLSSGMLLDDFSNFSSKITKDTDVIIFGGHGKSYSDTININENFTNAETFILCSNNLHFTQNAYDIYKAKGCKIYSHPYAISIIQ